MGSWIDVSLFFTATTTASLPHPHLRHCGTMSRTTLIVDDALGAVGNTPLVRLDRIAKEQGLQCNLRECMLRTPSVVSYLNP